MDAKRSGRGEGTRCEGVCDGGSDPILHRSATEVRRDADRSRISPEHWNIECATGIRESHFRRGGANHREAGEEGNIKNGRREKAAAREEHLA